MARTTAKNAQEILMADFQALVADTERLLEHTASLAGDQAEELRAQIKDSLLKARESLDETKETLQQRGQAAVVATEVVPELLESSLMLASHALILLGLSEKTVRHRVDEVRHNRYHLLEGCFESTDPREASGFPREDE